mmetsp:Transcript_111568/g.280690  ORF Transcript_111568/g.280690 Transcript_111568/m.280690 type:complete len:91 (+) Transcript_111568:682-954(+)
MRVLDTRSQQRPEASLAPQGPRPSPRPRGARHRCRPQCWRVPREEGEVKLAAVSPYAQHWEGQMESKWHQKDASWQKASLRGLGESHLMV